MGFFSRKPRTAHAAPGPGPLDGPVDSHHHQGAGAGVGVGKHSHAKKRGPFGRRGEAASPYSMSSRPTFGQWIKHTALDLVTMLILGAIGLGVYFADPAPSRSFAITFSDGEIVYPQFAYPLRKEIIPIWAAAMLAVFVPIVIFLIMQIRVRSFWDVNNATIGLFYSLIGAAVFQVFVKWLIGGLRPHFLDVCKPDPALIQAAEGMGKGFKEMYFQPDVCTGDKAEINDALESFPSGHTTAAFAGFVFLYLYLNAKLKVFSNYHPAFWKLIAIYAPILGAVLIGGALTIDEYHNWYDIFAGAAIGTVFAFSSYRMVYAAIWDFRYNHIPLNRGAPFMYGHGNGSVELQDALFTRKAGWGGRVGKAGLVGEKNMHHGRHGGHSNAINNNGLDNGYGNGVHNGHSNVLNNGHHNGLDNGLNSGHANGLHNDGLATGHHNSGHGLTGGHHGGHGLGHNAGHYNDSSIPRRPVGAHTEGDNIV